MGELETSEIETKDVEDFKEEKQEHLDVLISQAIFTNHYRLGRHSLRANRGSGTTRQPRRVWLASHNRKVLDDHHEHHALHLASHNELENPHFQNILNSQVLDLTTIGSEGTGTWHPWQLGCWHIWATSQGLASHGHQEQRGFNSSGWRTCCSSGCCLTTD